MAVRGPLVEPRRGGEGGGLNRGGGGVAAAVVDGAESREGPEDAK